VKATLSCCGKSNRLGFFADEVPEVRLRDDVSVQSDTRLLHHGLVNLCAPHAGRPYGVEGRVVRGAERGATLGFPTANLKLRTGLSTRRRYVTATLIDGQWLRSVTNIGTRPTSKAGGQLGRDVI